MKKTLTLLVVFCILAGSGMADFNWNAETGNWADGAKWDKGVAPNGSENVNVRFSATSVCTLNTAEGPFTNRLIVQNGQTWNIENGGSIGFAWSRVGRNTAAYVNLSGNGSFLMNNDDLYIGLENGYCEWIMSDTSSLVVNADSDDGDELYIAEDGGSALFKLIGSGVTVNVDRIRLTANGAGGTVVLEYVMDAGGASPIVAQRTYIGESGAVHLVLSADEPLAEEDIVLIEATSSYGIGGPGFVSMNGGSAAEGARIVLGGNLYELSYAYDAGNNGNNNDAALVFVRSARHMARQPNPAEGAAVGSSPTTLSWTLPDPNDGVSDITCTVYFGIEPPDPNRTGMDKKVLAPNVSTVELNAVNFPTFGVQPLADANDYYWVVDCADASPGMGADDGKGVTWTFSTDYNEAPLVDAGPDQVTWGLPNVISLAGSVNDDGKPNPPAAYTVAWTQISGTAVTPDSPNAESTTVTVTEAGVYEFELTADDGEKQGSDTVRVIVGTDSCEASYLNGSAYNSKDFNQDCVVDLADFADFAVDWLACTNTLEGC